MFSLRVGKLEENEYYREHNLVITSALCKNFEIIHFTENEQKMYGFIFGEELSYHSDLNKGNAPGVQFRMTLDLNTVDRVPFDAFVQYLSKNPWFKWSVDLEKDDIFYGNKNTGNMVFRGKL